MGKPSRRQCVFCGGTPVSAEHVWPRWIRKTPAGSIAFANRRYLDQPRVLLRTDVEMTASGPLTIVMPEFVGRHRPVFDATVKVPCKPCNNGWMAQLEDRTAPILEPLMSDPGALDALPSDAFPTLRRWAIKTASMFQYTDPTSKTVSAATLRVLKDEDATLPGSWFVGAYRLTNPDLAFRLTHVGGPYAGAWEGRPSTTPNLGRVGATLIGVHQLGLLVAHADGPWAPEMVGQIPGASNARRLDDGAAGLPVISNQEEWIGELVPPPVARR